MVLYFLATLKITNRNAKLRRESNEKDIEQTGLRNESLSNFETVKAFLFEIYFSTYNNSTSLRKNTNLGVTERLFIYMKVLNREVIRHIKSFISFRVSYLPWDWLQRACYVHTTWYTVRHLLQVSQP